jgi:hypothetical protein
VIIGIVRNTFPLAKAVTGEVFQKVVLAVTLVVLTIMFRDVLGVGPPSRGGQAFSESPSPPVGEMASIVVSGNMPRMSGVQAKRPQVRGCANRNVFMRTTMETPERDLRPLLTKAGSYG